MAGGGCSTVVLLRLTVHPLSPEIKRCSLAAHDIQFILRNEQVATSQLLKRCSWNCRQTTTWQPRVNVLCFLLDSTLYCFTCSTLISTVLIYLYVLMRLVIEPQYNFIGDIFSSIMSSWISRSAPPSKYLRCLVRITLNLWLFNLHSFTLFLSSPMVPWVLL